MRTIMRQHVTYAFLAMHAYDVPINCEGAPSSPGCAAMDLGESGGAALHVDGIGESGRVGRVGGPLRLPSMSVYLL